MANRCPQYWQRFSSRAKRFRRLSGTRYSGMRVQPTSRMIRGAATERDAVRIHSCSPASYCRCSWAIAIHESTSKVVVPEVPLFERDDLGDAAEQKDEGSADAHHSGGHPGSVQDKDRCVKTAGWCDHLAVARRAPHPTVSLSAFTIGRISPEATTFLRQCEDPYDTSPAHGRARA